MDPHRSSQTHKHTVDVVASQVFARGLEQTPVSAPVVRNVRLHSVCCLLVGQEHPFDSCHLQTQTAERSQMNTTADVISLRDISIIIIIPIFCGHIAKMKPAH